MDQEQIEMEAFVDGFIAGILECFPISEEQARQHRKLAEILFKQRQLTKVNNQ